MTTKLEAYFTDRVLPAVCAFHGVEASDVLKSNRKLPVLVAARRDAVRILRGTVKAVNIRGSTPYISAGGFENHRFSCSPGHDWYPISLPMIARLLWSKTHATIFRMLKSMEAKGEATAVTLDGYPENCRQYAHGKARD